jgi:hypothetical protein
MNEGQSHRFQFGMLSLFGVAVIVAIVSAVARTLAWPATVAIAVGIVIWGLVGIVTVKKLLTFRLPE